MDAQCVYVGGSTESPTYGDISDYTEGVTVRWDTSKTSYADMVEFFFERATLRGSCGGRQYMEGVWW